MDIQLIAAIIFFTFLSIFLLRNKKKIKIQKIIPYFLYFAMYRTKLGLKFMDKTAKNYDNVVKGFATFGTVLIGVWIFNDLSNIVSSWIKGLLLLISVVVIISLFKDPKENSKKLMVIVGFLGMGLIAYELLKNIVMLFTEPEVAAQSVGLVLPFQVKGAFYVPFIYWIISIFILAVVHEGSHGILARLFKIRIKSSGFAFLGLVVPILPAAFVEPEEKELEKKKPMEQMAVFAAGPFSNIVLGMLVLLVIAFLMPPVVDNMVSNDGVMIAGLLMGPDNTTYPAQEAGIELGEKVLMLDSTKTMGVDEFSEYLDTKSPGEQIIVTTNVSQYPITLAESPDDVSQGYMGIQIRQSTEINQAFVDKYGQFTVDATFWFSGLLFWLYLLNIGIGLFNLVPLGPVDGGRMLRTLLLQYFPEKKAENIWKRVSSFFLFIILVMIVSSFVIPK